jgi:chemotaxis protein MotB
MALDSDFEEGLSRNKSNPNAWMLTFADLLSLILTFFVMLYATQQVEKEKWEQMVDSLSERLNPNREQAEIQNVRKAHSHIDEPVAINLDYLHAVLDEKFIDIPEFSQNRIRRFDDRLVISFSTASIFGSNPDQISEEARDEIDKLSSVLSSIGNRVEVASHVGTETSTGGASVWKYTIKQASVVANEFKRSGYIYSVAAFGLGDSRAKASKSEKAINGVDHIDVIVREMTATE